MKKTFRIRTDIFNKIYANLAGYVFHRKYTMPIPKVQYFTDEEDKTEYTEIKFINSKYQKIFLEQFKINNINVVDIEEIEKAVDD